MAPFALSFSSVVWAALRAGSCGFVSWRVSLHAPSGRVAVASFDTFAAASGFARAQARLLGRAVVMRPGPRCSWRVSVPVRAWQSPHHGQLSIVGQGGGVAGVARALRALGFVSAVA